MSEANGWILVCGFGKEGDSEAIGDSTLYIEFTQQRKGEDGVENLPKRPNDGTVRATVASGWFANDDGFPEFGKQPWYDLRNRIGKVVIVDAWSPKSCRYLFDGLRNCREFDLLNLDTSRADSLEGMFRGCASLGDMLDADRFDVSRVEDVSFMFMNCLCLRAVSIAGWDTGKVTSYEGMFSGCKPYVLADKSQEAFLSKVTHKDTSEGVWSKAIG